VFSNGSSLASLPYTHFFQKIGANLVAGGGRTFET
jgi:hypothetical protein